MLQSLLRAGLPFAKVEHRNTPPLSEPMKNVVSSSGLKLMHVIPIS